MVVLGKLFLIGVKMGQILISKAVGTVVEDDAGAFVGRVVGLVVLVWR